MTRELIAHRNGLVLVAGIAFSGTAVRGWLARDGGLSHRTAARCTRTVPRPDHEPGQDRRYPVVPSGGRPAAEGISSPGGPPFLTPWKTGPPQDLPRSYLMTATPAS